METWRFADHVKYDALALIAPVIADGDESWIQVYGTRAQDHRTVTAKLSAFDEANPQPLELVLNVRCGLCDQLMALHEWKGRSEMAYACEHRHADGRYHHTDKETVDDAVDRMLIRRLDDRSHWALAPELAPAPEVLATYVVHLVAKLEIYDAHIGAAKADRLLSGLRARLSAQLGQVREIQEHGAFVVAGLDAFARNPWRSVSTRGLQSFTDLGRAILVERVICHREHVQVSTRIDRGTSIHRRLRAEELREEIAATREELRNLEVELAGLE